MVLLASALYALVRWVSYSPFRHAASERLVLAGQEQSHFIETLRAITPLKLFARENKRRARWQPHGGSHDRDFQPPIEHGFQFRTHTYFGLENLCVFWLGAKIILPRKHKITAQAFFYRRHAAGFHHYKVQFQPHHALINQALNSNAQPAPRQIGRHCAHAPPNKIRHKATCPNKT